MNHELRQSAEKYSQKRKGRKTWHKVVGILGCVVVFCTSYALILPAITMSRETYCGHEEHTHTAACYGAVTVTEPICTVESLGIHVHGEGCYDEDGAVVCGSADYLLHSHDERCYSEDGTLWCPLPERAAHVHGEECYVETEVRSMVATAEPHSHTDSCYGPVRGELVCTTEESQGHTHGEDCYTHTSELTCTIPEAEGHTHGEGCYTQQQGALQCTVEDSEHVHGDECYGVEQVLTCTMEESAGHAHGEDCYTHTSELTCTTPESEGHAHSDACYAWSEGLTCGLSEGQMVKGEPVETVSIEKVLMCPVPEERSHSHGDDCFCTVELEATSDDPICGKSEHKHKLICYSDPNADVESRSDWEATLPAELSGDIAEDMMSIAISQLGYQESVKNYTVLEDGETMLGYSRYGDWYGVPYGDWCAMFVSFCLHYADVEGMPLHSAVRPWIDELKTLELYHDADEYEPQRGDVIFFDWEVDGKADHVGLVAEVIEATEDAPAKIKTIEGNSSDCVQYVTYNLSDKRIFGYSSLPGTRELVHYLCLNEEHSHTEDCYAEDGSLICTLTEHVHTEQCMVRTVFYTDHTIRAFAEISGVEELPADLQLELWQVSAEQEPGTYAAMQTALGETMADSPHFIGAATFYQMRLTSSGEVYELPAEAQVKVNVEFTETPFTPEELAKAVETHAFTLTPDETAQELAQSEAAEIQPQSAEDGSAATATLSAKVYNAGEGETGGSYQADAIDDTQSGEDGINGLSYTGNGLMPFAVMLTSTVQEGTFWTRVDSTADITAGGTYMIISAEGNYALRGNANSNYQPVTLHTVKSNEEYYTISIRTNGTEDPVNDALLYWTITRNNNNYTIRCQGDNQLYLRPNRTGSWYNYDYSPLTSSSSTVSLSFITPENCWRINSGSYYLKNTGDGSAFTSSTDSDRSGTGTLATTVTHYYTRDMLIFKLSDVTELEIPDDVTANSGTGSGGEVDAPDKPDYPEIIQPSDSKTGDTVLTDPDEDTITVNGKYFSDAATSDIESGYQKDSFDEQKAIDGKVVTDKSVIYGGDDYGAYESYDANTFGVTLSTLGQEYPLPYNDIIKTPIDVVFVLDVSGSMTVYKTKDGETRIHALTEAFNTAMHGIMESHEANRVGVVLFSSGAWEMLPLDRYTADDNDDKDTIPNYLEYHAVTMPYGGNAKEFVHGSASLKTESGTSYANAGWTGTPSNPSSAVGQASDIHQGVGTYTQAGIALGEKVFADIGDDTIYTATIGEGETQRQYDIKRQPVFVLLSDGEPTHATSNYMDPLSGPHYGDGNGDEGEGNINGVQGYYTILSANYFKRQVGIQYDKPAKFYTIGMGIKEAPGTSDESSAADYDDDKNYDSTNDGSGDRYKRWVLDPDPTTIASLSSEVNGDDTVEVLKDIILGNYNAQAEATRSKWPDPWTGVPHIYVPVLKDNPYEGDYSYADEAYFGQMSTGELTDIFDTIVETSTEATPYGFVLFRRSNVSITDNIGVGMELKSVPVLRYDGVNYDDPVITVDGNVTTYRYEGSFTDPYLPNRTVDLSEITVTVTRNEDGTQTVDMVVPDTALPTYTPELIGKEFYYQMLPVRLIYQVGLTEESVEQILELQKTGGELTFYTNRFDDGCHAESILLPSEQNPFYNSVNGSTPAYQPHVDNKAENVSGSLDYVIKCDKTTVTETNEKGEAVTLTQVHHDLGNNGKLVFEAEAVDLPVEKNWIGFDADQMDPITVTLYRVTVTENADGSQTLTSVGVDTAALSVDNQWKHSFSGLAPSDGTWFYAIAETVPTGCQVKYSGETVTITGADGAPVKAGKVDFTAPDGVLVTITNSPGVVLPNTGGIGLVPYTITGLTLMLVSTAFLLHGRKRRREAR